MTGTALLRSPSISRWNDGSAPPGGVTGYIARSVVITLAYGLFQTANNTSVMRGVRRDQRGVVSGTLTLSRNLGLVTGASVMGAVFALASGTSDISAAHAEDVATGMRTRFAVAAVLIVVALAVAIKSQICASPRLIPHILTEAGK